MGSKFWTNDPSILITDVTELWPWAAGLSIPEKYNALTRLVVVISAVVAVIERSPVPLLFAALAVGAIVVTFHMTEKTQTLSQSTTIGMRQEMTFGDNTLPLEQSYPTTDGLTTVNADEDNIYGNPCAYDHCTAVNQKPLGCLEETIAGDQFIDKLFTGTEIVPPGLNFSRIPDTTLMARAPYQLSSADMSGRVVGGTDNSGSLALRFM